MGSQMTTLGSLLCTHGLCAVQDIRVACASPTNAVGCVPDRDLVVLQNCCWSVVSIHDHWQTKSQPRLEGLCYTIALTPGSLTFAADDSHLVAKLMERDGSSRTNRGIGKLARRLNLRLRVLADAARAAGVRRAERKAAGCIGGRGGHEFETFVLNRGCKGVITAVIGRCACQDWHEDRHTCSASYPTLRTEHTLRHPARAFLVQPPGCLAGIECRFAAWSAARHFRLYTVPEGVTMTVLCPACGAGCPST